MENFKNHIKPFGMLRKPPIKDPMAPSYIKPDGTKVIEKIEEFGKTVYEISPDHTLISRTYDKQDNLILDYARRVNLEIGHRFDEFGQKIYEFEAFYDEKNTFVRKKETEFTYNNEGKLIRSFTVPTPGQIKTEILYDESGNMTEKIEYRGSVKTFYNSENKAYKREIDRGSGGIITEEL